MVVNQLQRAARKEAFETSNERNEYTGEVERIGSRKVQRWGMAGDPREGLVDIVEYDRWGETEERLEKLLSRKDLEALFP